MRCPLLLIALSWLSHYKTFMMNDSVRHGKVYTSPYKSFNNILKVTMKIKITLQQSTFYHDEMIWWDKLSGPGVPVCCSGGRGGDAACGAGDGEAEASRHCSSSLWAWSRSKAAWRSVASNTSCCLARAASLFLLMRCTTSSTCEHHCFQQTLLPTPHLFFGLQFWIIP